MIELKDKDNITNEDIAMLLHDMQMECTGHKSVAARWLKEFVPVLLKLMEDDHDRNTPPQEMLSSVCMVCTMIINVVVSNTTKPEGINVVTQHMLNMIAKDLSRMEAKDVAD